MADRQVKVNVDIRGGGNLAQTTAAANAQVERLLQTMKGAAQAAAQLARAERAAGNAIAAAGNAAAGGGGGGGGKADAFAPSRLAERIERATRAAGLLGAAGMASIYGGINSVSPEAGSQVTNSFRMIANEIGIATIPAATRFTSALQGLSRAIRSVNEGTGGWAGNVAFAGAATLTGIGALGMGLNMVRSAAQGFGAMGSALGIGAGAGGMAAMTSAGAFAVPAASVALVATAIGDSIYASRAATQAQAAGFTPPTGQEQQYQVFRFLNRIPAVSTGVNLAQSVMNLQDPARAMPAHGIGAWLGETLGIGAPGPGQQGGPDDVTNRQPRIYQSPEELYTSMLMRSTGTPPAIAEQEQRANEALISALGELTTAIQATSGEAAWGPPASDNG